MIPELSFLIGRNQKFILHFDFQEEKGHNDLILLRITISSVLYGYMGPKFSLSKT